VQNEKSHFRQPPNIYKIHVIGIMSYTIILYTDDMGRYYFIYFGIDFQKEHQAPHAVYVFIVFVIYTGTTATFWHKAPAYYTRFTNRHLQNIAARLSITESVIIGLCWIFVNIICAYIPPENKYFLRSRMDYESKVVLKH